MTHALMNVVAIAILAISGKRGVVDVFVSVFISMRRSGLKCALSQTTFLYGDHYHWRSSPQGRFANFSDPVLRENWFAAEDSAHWWAAPLRNRGLELLGGHRCGQTRWVPNGRDQASLSRIWQRDSGVPPLANTRA